MFTTVEVMSLCRTKLSINVVGRQAIRIPSSFPQKHYSLGAVMSTIRHKWIILVVLWPPHISGTSPSSLNSCSQIWAFLYWHTHKGRYLSFTRHKFWWICFLSFVAKFYTVVDPHKTRPFKNYRLSIRGIHTLDF